MSPGTVFSTSAIIALCWGCTDKGDTDPSRAGGGDRHIQVSASAVNAKEPKRPQKGGKNF